jgi:hypothetical protein
LIKLGVVHRPGLKAAEYLAADLHRLTSHRLAELASIARTTARPRCFDHAERNPNEMLCIYEWDSLSPIRIKMVFICLPHIHSNYRDQDRDR